MNMTQYGLLRLGGQLFFTLSWTLHNPSQPLGSRLHAAANLWTGCRTSATPYGQSHSAPSHETVTQMPCLLFVFNQLSGLADSFTQMQDDIIIVPSQKLTRTKDSPAGARLGHLVYSSSRSINLMRTVSDIFQWMFIDHMVRTTCIHDSP